MLAEIDSLSIETAFETGALFRGSSLIKFKTSFLETVSKEKFCYQSLFLSFYRSSYRGCSVEKDVLENFTKFTGKHLFQSLNKKISGTSDFL